MIQHALTGEFEATPKTLEQQQSDFTAEGAPPPRPAPHPVPGAEPRGAPAAPTPPGRAMMLPMASPDTGIAIDDWDVLLRAVTERLRQAVGDTLPHALNGATAPLRASVLECVDALDRLHGNLLAVLAQPSSIMGREGSVGATPVQAVTAVVPDRVAAAQP